MITNGVLINDEKACWIAKHIHYVTLSCDILPELQINRSFPDGKNSHKAVMRAAQLLCKHGVPCHFRTTISYTASTRLREMVEYTHKHTGVKTIRFEPMAEIGRASDTDMNKPAQQDFVDAFIAAYELGKKYGILVTCKMMTNIQRRSTRFCNIEFAITSEGIRASGVPVPLRRKRNKNCQSAQRLGWRSYSPGTEIYRNPLGLFDLV